MYERRCPACDRELVQRPNEDVYHFRMRKTCNRICFAKQARERGRAKVEAKGALEHEEAERHTLELRAQKRAELEAQGCVFTDNER